MGKYVIVDENRKETTISQNYEITYQLTGNDTQMYKIILDCYHIADDDYRYCFIADQTGYQIDTPEDKAEFLKELYEYQKGDSYRKTHPIKFSDEAMISKLISQKDDEIRLLNRELQTIREQKKQLMFNNYYQDVNIDKDELDKYLSELKQKLFENDRYKVHNIQQHIWDGIRAYIYDKKIQRDVKVIIFDVNTFNVRDLDVDDMKIDSTY